MEGFIEVIKWGLIVLYTGIAVYTIVKSETYVQLTVKGIGFLIGGFFIMTVAEKVAPYIGWGLVVITGLFLLGLFLEVST